MKADSGDTAGSKGKQYKSLVVSESVPDPGDVEVAVVDGYVLAPGGYEVWEQLEGETDKQFEAFCIYRDLGGARTTAGTGKAIGKCTAMMWKWSSMNAWPDRARRYTAHIDRKARMAVEADRVGMLRQHADTAKKIVSMVDKWVDAQLEQIQTGDLSAVPDSQISSLMRVAVMVERQSLGLPSDESAVAHEHTHRIDQDQLDDAIAPVADWVSKLRARAEELGIDVEGPEIIDVEPREVETAGQPDTHIELDRHDAAVAHAGE